MVHVDRRQPGRASPIRAAVRAVLALGCVAALAAPRASADDAASAPPASPPSQSLRSLDEGPYETPYSGEGFRTKVLGQDVLVEPRDRRSVTAWSLGLQVNEPRPQDNEVLPTAAIFVWRRPDEESMLRAVIVGVYDDLLYAHSLPDFWHIALIATFNNYNVPTSRSVLIDGTSFEPEQMTSGNVIPGVGIGYWTPVGPGRVDNVFSVGASFEPGYFYFKAGEDSARNFVTPKDTWEWRAHFKLRYDDIERNLLELPHSGIAFGVDAIYGYRDSWHDWGVNANHNSHATTDYAVGTAYFVAAGRAPFVDEERHRMIGYLYAGIGTGVDQFSAPQLGGGPYGSEMGSLGRALLPGAVINEFNTNRYVSLVGEYRYEAIFFIYPSVRASVAYVNRQRRKALGSSDTYFEDDYLGSIGCAVTSGFAFHSELHLTYDYNWGVVRGEHGSGGHVVVLQVSGEF